ncbi:MAG: hypothetical protein Q9227_007217 [Pyrenula ochraceoflavens]
MSRSRLFFTTCLFTGFVLAFPTEKSFWSSTNSLLVFGDSYSYVQGTSGRQNYSFIGDAFNYSFTPSELLSDSIVQNQIGTSAGGPNWVEYLTDCFSGLPAECGKNGTDAKELWDFAFAGADVTTRFTTLHHNYSVDLDHQIAQYLAYASQPLALNLPPASTLVAIFIGINDISDTAKWTNVSFPDLYSDIISAELESATKLTTSSNSSGLAFESFLFLNLPPLEKTPGNVVAAAKNQTLYPSYEQVSSWNSILSDKVDSWKQTTNVRDAWVFDTYSYLNNVIKNPSQYGIMGVTG